MVESSSVEEEKNDYKSINYDVAIAKYDQIEKFCLPRYFESEILPNNRILNDLL